MNKDQLKGTIKDAAGNVQRRVGQATGNGTQQIVGLVRQAEGKVQKVIGDIRQAHDDKAHDDKALEDKAREETERADKRPR